MTNSHDAKQCPQCGSRMVFRLGDYECPDCGTRAPKGQVEPDHGPSGPGFREEQWGSKTPAPRSQPLKAPPVKSSVAYQSSAAPSDAGKVDFSPTGNKEKLILLGVFIVKAIINIVAASTGEIGGVEGVLTQLGSEAFNLGIIVAVFYIPWIWTKWCCATYTCFVGVLSFVGLFFSALMVPLAGLLVPSGGHIAFLGWLVSLANTFVYLWIASLLYRDIQQIQAN